jgi:hypothetical protein
MPPSARWDSAGDLLHGAGDLGHALGHRVDSEPDHLERLARLLHGRDAVAGALGALADDLDHAAGLGLDLGDASGYRPLRARLKRLTSCDHFQRASSCAQSAIPATRWPAGPV